MIRVGFSKVLNHTTEHITHHSESATYDHVDHCFDYLRQSIMCSSDTTLEWIMKDGREVDGWGVTHVCRNFKELFDWTERNWDWWDWKSYIAFLSANTEVSS